MLLITVSTISEADELPAFLIGTWKVKDKNSFEEWQRLPDGSLSGKVYRQQATHQQVTEYMTIKVAHSESATVLNTSRELVLSARVLNQNAGKAIDFRGVWVNGGLVFENPEHDFPNRIEYHHSDRVIDVNVLGNDGKGFSHQMLRVDDKD